MISLILRTTSRFLLPVVLLYSIFMLVQGHHEPGGGFVAGLTAAAALALYGIAYDSAAARRLLRLDPHTCIAAGLLISAGAAVLPLLTGRQFLTGMWGKTTLPVIGLLELGTPLFFDIGVFLVVLGVTMIIVLTLTET